MGKPSLACNGVVEKGQHRRLMIAFEEVTSKAVRASSQNKIDNRAAFWAPIDEVSKKDNNGRLCINGAKILLKAIQHPRQEIGPPVDVANRIADAADWKTGPPVSFVFPCAPRSHRYVYAFGRPAVQRDATAKNWRH